MNTNILCLIAAPFVLAALFDVNNWLKRAQTTVDARGNELAVASHGAGFLALASLAVWIVGPAEFLRFMRDAPSAFPDDWIHWLPALAFVAAVGWGFLWLVSGARRSLAWAGYRDSRFLTRAIVKIAIGGGLWLAFWNPSSSWSRDAVAWLTFARMMPTTGGCLMALIAWLIVTGCTKFLLVMWPRFVSARGAVADDIAAQEF